MDFRRLLISIRLAITPGAERRAEYLRRKKVFRSMGKNCLIMKRKIPLYPELISFGNNVRIASNVSFLTHDVVHEVLNNMDMKEKMEFPEKVGCISIGNDVFIGAGTRILYDVRIGSKVIIGTGSIVTHDIPDNTVVAGVPARKIGTFDNYVENIKKELKETTLDQRSKEYQYDKIEYLWQEFCEKHPETK